MNIQEAWQWGKDRLETISDSSDSDSLLLLSFVLQIKKTQVIANPNQCLTEIEKQRFENLVAQRSQEVPIPYLVQTCEFYSLPFKVDPNCLIPRPETEILIDAILNYYSDVGASNFCVLDLGTGSGNIAITLKYSRPSWLVTALDQSEKALEIAKENARFLKTEICFIKSEWFTHVSQEARFHTIISNPPYIAEQDPHLLGSLRHEPQLALRAKNQGLSELYHIIEHAKDYLHAKGCLWLEHGYNQAQAVKDYLEKAGYCNIVQYKDLAGILRFSRATYP